MKKKPTLVITEHMVKDMDKAGYTKTASKMICDSCNKEAKRAKFIKGKWYCAECMGLNETGGTRGSLTRTRTRNESYMKEGDMIQPTVYDPVNRRNIMNEDFVKKYPDNVGTFYNPEDVQKSHPKLAKKIIKDKPREF